jgi:23S rRNA pseudouridine2605 synthase
MFKEEIKPARIAKVIAHSGHCSRREAEQLIIEGRVQVNGKFIDSPSTLITDHSIKIDGKLLNQKQETRLWLFHKPQGIITSNKDPQGRTTIFDILPKDLPRVVTIGRLDFNTEGLILLTTDGELARKLELPKNKFIRRYRVRVFGKLNEERLDRLKNGITIEGIRYSPILVEIEERQTSNTWLIVQIEEGKNREIRKVMEEMGLKVSRLIRTNFGPFDLGKLPTGQAFEVTQKIKSLLSN